MEKRKCKIHKTFQWTFVQININNSPYIVKACTLNKKLYVIKIYKKLYVIKIYKKKLFTRPYETFGERLGHFSPTEETDFQHVDVDV